MTQHEERHGHARTGGRTSEFVAEGRQRLDGLADAQSAFWDRIQTSNRKCFERIQSEASLTADFASKLASARSMDETANLLQNWTVKHMEMAAEDARHMLSDTKEIVAAGARFWTSFGPESRGRGH